MTTENTITTFIPPINSLPTPPLGYRLATKNDKRHDGTMLWYPGYQLWAPSTQTAYDLDPGFFYAVPLDDGYDYFEPRSTMIQAGDEAYSFETRPTEYVAYDPTVFGTTNRLPMRRPKAKPPTYAERQAACGLKVGDRVKVLYTPGDFQDGWGQYSGATGRYVGQVLEVERIDEEYGLLLKGAVYFPYFVLEKVSPLAPGRNINGLTEEQVGVSEGWRLITEDEIVKMPTDCEMWDPITSGWGIRIYPCQAAYPDNDYRTKAPLPAPPTPIPLTSSDWANGPWWVREGRDRPCYLITEVHNSTVYCGLRNRRHRYFMDNGWERSKDLITWEPCISNWRELDDN